MTVQADLYLHQDDESWSERYYLDPPDEPLLDTLDRLGKARKGLLRAPCVLVRGRAVHLDRPRLPADRTFNFTGDFLTLKLNNPGVKINVAANASWVVALMRWVTAAGASRIMSIGGILAAGFGPKRTSLFNTLAADETTRLDAFRDALGGPGLKLQIREMLPDSETFTAPVASISTNAKGLYQIQTTEDFLPAEDDPVRIMGSRGNNLGRLRGLRRIVHRDSARSFTLDRGPLPERGPIRYTGGAVARAAVYRFDRALWLPMGLADETEVLLKLLPLDLLNVVLWRGHPDSYSLSLRRRGSGQPQRRGRARAR